MNLNTTLRKSYDTDLMILRTMFALDPDTNLPISTNFVVTTDGIGGLTWMSPFTNLSTAGLGVGYLPSTIDELRSNVSSLSTLVSSIVVGLSSLSTVLGQSYISSGIYSPQLTSTTVGLGSIGYVSTGHLRSTVEGLGTSYYVSTLSLMSTVSWFIDPLRFVSTGALVSTTAGILPLQQLTSSVKGLGSAGYISTGGLVSSVQGLGTAGYISTGSLVSTVAALGTTLVSTVNSLGSQGYVSTSQLTSTVAWFQDASRYISTGNLISTVAGISTNQTATFYIDNGNEFTILGGTVIVSSVNTIAYLSTFLLSSVTYQGVNGSITPTVYPDPTTGRNLFFSSATIPFDRFSSFILSNTRLNLDLYPNFVFPRLNTGASGYSFFPMSTFLAYGTGYLYSQVATSYVYAGTQAAGFGNPYQQPIQLQIPGSLIANTFGAQYRIVHNLPDSVTSNLTPGFVNGAMEVRYGSTNSVFLSIQNLP
jgi:hypothetical protein